MERATHGSPNCTTARSFPRRAVPHIVIPKPTQRSPCPADAEHWACRSPGGSSPSQSRELLMPSPGRRPNCLNGMLRSCPLMDGSRPAYEGYSTLSPAAGRPCFDRTALIRHSSARCFRFQAMAVGVFRTCGSVSYARRIFRADHLN